MSGLLGSLLVVVPILVVGAAIVIAIVRFRRGRSRGSSTTFASFVGENLAPPQFSTEVPGARAPAKPARQTTDTTDE